MSEAITKAGLIIEFGQTLNALGWEKVGRMGEWMDRCMDRGMRCRWMDKVLRDGGLDG